VDATGVAADIAGPARHVHGSWLCRPARASAATRRPGGLRAAYDGDASWIGYALIRGRWFAGTRSRPSRRPSSSGRPACTSAITLTLTGDGGRTTVRLVGEILDTDKVHDDPVVRGAWADLASLEPGSQPTAWEMRPRDGVDARTLRGRDPLRGARTRRLVRGRDADRPVVRPVPVGRRAARDRADRDLPRAASSTPSSSRPASGRGSWPSSRRSGSRRGRSSRWCLASIVPLGLLAGLIGVPIGIAAQHAVLVYMGDVAAQTDIPPVIFDVFPPVAFLGLALAGLGIARRRSVASRGARRARADRADPARPSDGGQWRRRTASPPEAGRSRRCRRCRDPGDGSRPPPPPRRAAGSPRSARRRRVPRRGPPGTRRRCRRCAVRRRAGDRPPRQTSRPRRRRHRRRG
jgi:hypothetical protein